MSNASTALAHQFDDSEQQHDASWIGMWIFLATEVMFFGGMFTGYTIYRIAYAQAIANASNHLNIWLGGINTAVRLLQITLLSLSNRDFNLRVYRW